jgi:hypothetical protein
MKWNYFRFFLPAMLLLLTTCEKEKNDENPLPEASDYYVLNITQRLPAPGVTLLDVDSYQQTTEYTCGPAAVITLLKYYGKQGDEMIIANEMGTSTTVGTNPQQMAAWLNTHGFVATWHENGTLELLRENLGNQIPTLVEWSDWGGHWVLVIGYDTRNTESLDDDVIIFADPYDRHDDNLDGIDWFNAGRFYYMWYDALLFGQLMRRIYVTANPV